MHVEFVIVAKSFSDSNGNNALLNDVILLPFQVIPTTIYFNLNIGYEKYH